MPSKRFALDMEDAKKILKGALMAAIGVFITFLLEALGKIDFGSSAPLVSALLSIAANATQKFFAGK
jgi:hypothetical protein